MTISVFFQNALCYYCVLYINSPRGSTDAVTPKATFAHITCIFCPMLCIALDRQ